MFARASICMIEFLSFKDLEIDEWKVATRGKVT